VAGKMWRFLDVAPDLPWHIFQAFPMRGTHPKISSGEDGRGIAKILRS